MELCDQFGQYERIDHIKLKKNRRNDYEKAKGKTKKKLFFNYLNDN